MVPQATCPASASLKALLLGMLPPTEENALGDHLESCPHCQAALQELAASGASWESLAHHLGDTPPPPETALQEALARMRTPALGETLPEATLDHDLLLGFLDPPRRPAHLGRLDTYDILGVIGHGGMGVVLKAFDTVLNRTVAIKVLAPQLASLPSARHRFLREAQAAAGLSHENIVSIHAVGETRGLPYLVMHYVEGASLEGRLKNGPLPLAVIVRTASAVARGLQAAHERGLVHRDVKPANILLEAGTDRVKLTDFGLARAVDDSSLTQSGVVAGTPQYMAPEQARGEAVDHRADLFSLGSVLYAMCTGKPPFEGRTPLAILRRVSDETPRPVREINEHTPRWLAALIARLHARASSDRFASAAEVADLLDRHLTQLQDPATPPSETDTPPPAARPARKRSTHRRLFLALAGCLGFILLSLAALQTGRVLLRRPPTQQQGADLPAGAGAAEADRETLASQAREVLATHCYRCHGENGAVEGGFNYLMDREQLVSHKKVRPGQPDQSRLLRRIADGEMPPDGENPRPGPEELDLLSRWIAAGAPSFGPPSPPRPFLSPSTLARSIHSDLDKQKERDRRFTRYFTLAHLFNAGLSEDELQTYRNGLSKLLNSLSWKKTIVLPVPIDATKTVLRIDLRDYGWSSTEWEALVAAYPYGMDDRSSELQEDARSLDTAQVYLRGDWFVAHASRPPLYHQLLQLPASERELEKLLHINVEENIHSERVARAGFNGSGVARNNRLIERHETPYGAYWKTYDFTENTGVQNLFEHPLGPGSDERSFCHTGSEIIFSLPNGLQGYLLVNGKGRRIDRAPTEIVSDPRRSDRAVENGLSCMACHPRGLNPKADQVRAVVEATPGAFPSKEERDTILALYAPEKVFAELLHKDRERFQKAAAQTGARVGTTEPIMALAEQLEAPLDLRRAAAEVGMLPRDFLALLERKPAVERAIGVLKVPGGKVPRQTFESVFSELVSEEPAASPGKKPHRQPEPRGDGPSATVVEIPRLSLNRKVEVKLPEPFTQVRTGGAGRFLLFHLKKARQLAVFDVAKVGIVRTIDLPSDDVLFAAGRDKLLLVVPGQRLLQRWDLHTGSREKTAPIAEERPIRKAVMGSGSNGPLLLWSAGKVQLWDVARLEPVNVPDLTLAGDPQWGFDVRVSADGQTFVGWATQISSRQYGVTHLHNGKAVNRVSPDGHSFNAHWAMPSADGSLVFRYGGGIYEGEDMKILAADSFTDSVLIPTEDPRYFLSVREDGPRASQVTICTSADRLKIYTLRGVERVTGSSLSTFWGYVNGEPRIHYLPSAGALVTLPESNDTVVVRPFNLLETLGESGVDYLFVLSCPPRRASPGSLFHYRMDGKSRSGGLRYRLESGPEGMTVSSSGVIHWPVPQRLDRPTVRVIVTVRSASGKETQHAFDLTIAEASDRS